MYIIFTLLYRDGIKMRILYFQAQAPISVDIRQATFNENVAIISVIFMICCLPINNKTLKKKVI